MKIVFSFLKSLAIIFATLMILTLMAMDAPRVALWISLALSLLATVALFKPLPKLKLNSRKFSFAFLFFAALPGLAVSIDQRNEQAGLAVAPIISTQTEKQTASSNDRRADQEDVSLSQEDIAERLRQKEQRAAFQARTAENAGFPDYETYQKAKAIGLSSYAQYKFVMNPGSMEAYCAWEDKSHAITLAANERFGESPNGDAFVKKRAWADERQEKLAEETAAALGVEYREMLAVADQRYWTARCTAKREGYAVADIDDLKRATKADGKAGLEVIEGLLMEFLAVGESAYYAQRADGVPDCRRKASDDMQLIMCRIIGTDYARQAFFYKIGKDEEGKLLVTPMTGASQARLLHYKQLKMSESEVFYVARPVGVKTDTDAWHKLFGIPHEIDRFSN